MSKCLSVCLVILLSGYLAILPSCGSSSSGAAADDDDGTDDEEVLTPAGTVTVSGTFASASPSVNLKPGAAKAVAVEGYVAQLLNARTGEQDTTAVAADGSFSFSATGSDRYVVNFYNDSNQYIGTLMTSAADSDGLASIGLITGADATTTDLGTITAAVDESENFTGQITSDATISSDSDQLAYTSDSIIAGGNTGDGSTNYATTVGLSCATAGAASCADYDFDGVPDIVDMDNNNNGYADEVDGDTDYCAAGTLALYVENYPTSGAAMMNFPTPTEVAANLGGTTMYQIHLELTPAEGSTIADISEVAVTTPSYIDTYGYVYGVTNTHDCFNTLWTDCVVDGVSYAKKLLPSDDGTKFEMALADIELIRAGVLENMFPGDTFLFTITMADSTVHECTRKINIIPKYYPYDLKRNGTAVNTNLGATEQISWGSSFTLSWTEPVPPGPPGMTYTLYFYPAQRTSGTDCAYSASTYGTIEAGQGVTSIDLTEAQIDAAAPSNVNHWGFELHMVDTAGDNSKVGPLTFATGDNSAPNNCTTVGVQ